MQDNTSIKAKRGERKVCYCKVLTPEMVYYLKVDCDNLKIYSEVPKQHENNKRVSQHSNVHYVMNRKTEVIHITECHLPTKRNERLIHATIWVHCENTPSEGSQNKGPHIEGFHVYECPEQAYS